MECAELEVTPQSPTSHGSSQFHAETSSIAPLPRCGPAINLRAFRRSDGSYGVTTVIGGVLSDDDRDSVTVPACRDPLLGNLFKRKNVSRDTAEIPFFITPRIYRPEFVDGVTATAGTKPKTTTIVQPVPLGNPASNSDPVQTIPVSNPAVQTAPGAQPAATPRQP